jgi:hypothetical protein
MKEKILALLIAQFTGVRKDGLNHLAGALSLQVATDDEATTVVGKLTADQVKMYIADWRKEADAEISKANKTHEDSLKKKYDFTEKKTDGTTPQVTPETIEAGNDMAAIQKIIADSIAAATKPLLEKVTAFEAGNAAKTRLTALNDKLKECKDDNFKKLAVKNFGLMQFTDEAFTEYLTEMETDIKTANQTVADSGLGEQSRPWIPNTTTSGGKEATDAEIAAIMGKIPI